MSVFAYGLTEEKMSLATLVKDERIRGRGADICTLYIAKTILYAHEFLSEQYSNIGLKNNVQVGKRFKLSLSDSDLTDSFVAFRLFL